MHRYPRFCPHPVALVIHTAIGHPADAEVSFGELRGRMAMLAGFGVVLGIVGGIAAFVVARLVEPISKLALCSARREKAATSTREGRQAAGGVLRMAVPCDGATWRCAHVGVSAYPGGGVS